VSEEIKAIEHKRDEGYHEDIKEMPGEPKGTYCNIEDRVCFTRENIERKELFAGEPEDI